MGWSPTDILSASTLGLVDFGGPDQPAAPDYTGAAEATSAGNLAMAREATQANRVNQTTPWGTSTWTRPTTATGEFDPTGTWTQTTALSPEQQALYNTQTQTSQTMGDIGLAGLGAAGEMFKTPLNFDKYGAQPTLSLPSGGQPTYTGPGEFGANRERVMNAMLQRSNAQIGQDREAKAAQLIAQGIPRGSEAFNREMTLLDQKQTDARQQAEIAATQQAATEYQAGLQGSEQQFKAEMIRRGATADEADKMYQSQVAGRKQGISEDLIKRQTPLNELNAFRSGTQVQSPQFAAVPQQQTTLGPDYMGATTATGNWDLAGWNAEQAQNNAIMGGLFQLGGAAIGGRK